MKLLSVSLLVGSALALIPVIERPVLAPAPFHIQNFSINGDYKKEDSESWYL
jgi:hypothetical protein